MLLENQESKGIFNYNQEFPSFYIENNKSDEENGSDEENPSPAFKTNHKFKKEQGNTRKTGIHINVSALNQSNSDEEEEKIQKKDQKAGLNTMHNKSGSTNNTSGYQNDFKNLSFTTPIMSKSLQYGYDYSKTNVSNLTLPVITEEDSNYLKNGPISPYELKKGNSLIAYEEGKFGKGQQMMSLASTEEFDGIIVPTKMNKKGESSISLLGQLRYTQSIQFSKQPTLIMKFSEDFRYLATGGQD